MSVSGTVPPSLLSVAHAPLLHALVDLLEPPCVILRDRGKWIAAAKPAEVLTARGQGSLAVIDAISEGWWAGWLSYESGHDVEAVAANESRQRPWAAGALADEADAAWARFPARIEIPDDGPPAVVGGGTEGSEHRLLLDAALEVAGRGMSQLPPADFRDAANEQALIEAVTLVGTPARSTIASNVVEAIDWHTTLDEEAHGRAVRRVLDHIRAGTCYQTNLTRMLWTTDPVSPSNIFHVLLDRHPAQYASFLQIDDTSVVSGSPEQLVRQFGRWIQTRPIKGTDSDPQRLLASTKDRAENVMIVDMARNDLGRVSRYGTVRVPSLFALEPHPGLFHLVSTVVGEALPDAGRSDVIRAVFPAASITGAPKPIVMQIIEDLEPWRRGVYCGSVGWIDADHDRMDLSVAIRTFVVRHGVLRFGVGGGIVADSRPAAEWAETELKAARFLEAAQSARFPRTSR